jgi:hypothetical protein
VTFTYQWYRDSKAISGATKAAYKLTKSDKGKRMSVAVTASTDGYNSLAKRSDQTGKVS